ncbi:MAG: hypothetical protein ACI9SK_001505 [Zhongshania sp.]|jgi:hypothetical protein
MKLTKALILVAGLGFFETSAYADHRGDNHYEARYQYRSSGYYHDHNQGYDKHNKGNYQHYNDHSYNKHRYSKHHYNKHYYARHEHSHRCGHRYQPAFNSRVKVVFGL